MEKYTQYGSGLDNIVHKVSPGTNPAIDVSIEPIQTIKDAKTILTIEILWDHFNLPGQPAKSCLSPFRNEGRPSFSVYENSKGEILFKDHGDPDCHGDSFEFYKNCVDPDDPNIFRSFLALAEEIRRTGPPTRSSRRLALVKPPDLTDYIAQGRSCSDSLLKLPRKIEEIAQGRGWLSETITRLATEGSVGWDNGHITFNYAAGIKYRVLGTKDFSWKGKAGTWRQNRLARAQRVFITEGETDCISLIDTSIESSNSTVVVAVPSASTFDVTIIPKLANKDVVLCLDNDPAGRAATKKIASLIHGIVASLKSWELEGAVK